MLAIPDLSACASPSDVVVTELEALDLHTPRGGPEWDPFRNLPKVQLTPAAQKELLGLAQEAEEAARAAERKLARARTERGRSIAAQSAYRFARINEWALETLMASLSLLLVSRVNIACQRFRGLLEPGDCMSHAVTSVLESLRTWEGTGPMHQYVTARIDAYLAQHAMDQKVDGNIPKSWQVILRHIPLITAELEAELDRAPTDGEVADRYLERARGWAEARIVEKGSCPDPSVLPELIDAKLTKQGTFAAVSDMRAIRALAEGPVSLAGLEEGGAEHLGAVAGAEAAFLSTGRSAGLGALLSSVEGLDTVQQRKLLSSSLWARVAVRKPVPVHVGVVQRGRPDPVALVAA